MNGYAIISDKMLQIGDQLDHYQIQAHLAQGGMSDIYRAFDMVNRREVAIKVPDQAIIGDPAQYERFQRELEVITRLQHPAIQRGLASGKYNRIPYLVAEFVDGRSLRTIIDETAPLPVETALALTRKIAEGLAYCHANDVVHRDLKPENILVTQAGQPVIMDFGLALTKGSHRVTYSNLSATMGTPDYMAPEQVEGQRGDPRTDIYALGTILFEMLTGHPPFTGDSGLAVMRQHLQKSAPRLDKLRTDVPIPIATIVARCLARDPADRFASMTALIEALDHPETVDPSLLESLDQHSEPAAFWKSQAVRGVLIALAVLAGFTLLAILLQSLHH